jgi:hypothetical protein
VRDERLKQLEAEVQLDRSGNKVNTYPFAYQPATNFKRNVWMHSIERAEKGNETVWSFIIVLAAALGFIWILLLMAK